MNTEQSELKELPQEMPSAQEAVRQDLEAGQRQMKEAASTETPAAASQPPDAKYASRPENEEEVPTKKIKTAKTKDTKPPELAEVQTDQASPAQPTLPSQPASPAQPTSPSLPAQPPKAFVAAQISTAGMGYRERAGLYLHDKNLYKQTIGGENLWK